VPHLPARFAAVILAFAPLFAHRSWQHARVLLIGAILAPGRRTVASALRITGRSRERRFGGKVLLGLLVDAFAPDGPVVLPSTTPSNGVGGGASPPAASTAIPCARPTPTSSRRAACAG
jgi:hypothetical protein